MVKNTKDFMDIFEDLNIQIEDGSIEKNENFIIAKEAITKKHIILLYSNEEMDPKLIYDLIMAAANSQAEIIAVISTQINKNIIRIVNWLNSISNKDSKFILEKSNF